ncbi:hypothetical protein BDB00DRAFT_636323 [Zychaea mexicana]|uniref:uncharacterized protein n=1 Tax=Zychaea mexicana TaxID=64656 RepID=UPI0022FE36B5|nr:uncharacterized protein BDB00DRAFT_636323 [Zychaea mexicana]KAI9489166.1 hypothetical protein BDB00DRAFT_636323 [Zychaea mexicana]
MSASIADIFEDYVESLQNLPGEIDQNMQELRNMDEDFQRKKNPTLLFFSCVNGDDDGDDNGITERQHYAYIGIRETYTKHRRSYAKVLRTNNANPPVNFAASRLQLDKEYKSAVQKQDQKIELALRMYDLVSKHIERIDSQMAKSGLDGGDWITNSGGGGAAAATMNATSTATVNSGATTNGRRRQQHPSNSAWDDGSSWRTNGAESGGGGPRKRSSLGPSSVRKRTHHSSRPTPSISHHGSLAELEIDPNEPRYCICNQVSFGDMVACDGENCEKEWFHYACVGLVAPPKGAWYCDDCADAANGYRKRLKGLTEDIA